MSFEDIPPEVMRELRAADFEIREQRFDQALHTLAICQQLVGVRSLRVTQDAAGNFTVSVLGDAAGQNHAVYALINRTQAFLKRATLGRPNNDDTFPA